MSPTIPAAQQRRTHLLASSLLVPVVFLNISAARAQQSTSPDQLPPIEVNPPGDQNRTRAKPVFDEEQGSRRGLRNVSPTGSPNPSGVPSTSPNVSPAGGATTNRQFAGIVGASATVI